MATAREAKLLPALTPGLCDWCGGPCGKDQSGRRKKYCSPACYQSYNNLCASQGKTIIHMLKIWRKHRGAKGTPGEGMIGEITSRLDDMLRDDAERKARLQA